MFKIFKLGRKKKLPTKRPKPSDQFLADIIRNSPDYAVLWLSENGVIEWANSGALEILEYKENEIYGRNFREIFTLEDSREGVHTDELARAVAEGRAEDERWHVRKSGERFWASGVMSFHRSKNMTGFCKVFRDITSRKLTEDEIKIANANLRSFSQTAAHDLQAPLRAITLSLQLALRVSSDLSDDVKKHLDTAVKSAKHMVEMIKNLLIHSEVGMKADAFTNAEANAVFDMAVSYLRPIIDEHNAAITKGSLPEFYGVPEEIERLFQNLITNAIKYRSGETPKLHMEAKLSGDEWIFSARDNGIGISPEYHERIFGSFQRVHTDEDRPGTGLGLAICNKIIELHRGRIWVKSEVGKGATFYFTLPKARRVVEKSRPEIN